MLQTTKNKTLQIALVSLLCAAVTRHASCLHPAETVVENFWKDFGHSLGLPCGEKCAFVTDSAIQTPAGEVPCELATFGGKACTLQQRVVFVAKEAGDHVHRLFLQAPFQRLKNSGLLRYVINCAPFSRLRKEFSRSYLEGTGINLTVFNNITWAAVSYFSRTQQLTLLLQPLRSMRDEAGAEYVKTRAVSFAFPNEGNGEGTALRWHFKNMLSRFEPQVETPHALRRASNLMFNEAVKAY
eukprot:6755788-Pyramimonas_sp.AAC.1